MADDAEEILGAVTRELLDIERRAKEIRDEHGEQIRRLGVGGGLAVRGAVTGHPVIALIGLVGAAVAAVGASLRARELAAAVDAMAATRTSIAAAKLPVISALQPALRKMFDRHTTSTLRQGQYEFSIAEDGDLAQQRVAAFSTAVSTLTRMARSLRALDEAVTMLRNWQSNPRSTDEFDGARARHAAALATLREVWPDEAFSQTGDSSLDVVTVEGLFLFLNRRWISQLGEARLKRDLSAIRWQLVGAYLLPFGDRARSRRRRWTWLSQTFPAAASMAALPLKIGGAVVLGGGAAGGCWAYFLR